MNLKERYQNKANSILGRLEEEWEEVAEVEDAEEEVTQNDNLETNAEEEVENAEEEVNSLEKEIAEKVDVYGIEDFLAALLNVLDNIDPEMAKAIKSGIGPLPED